MIIEFYGFPGSGKTTILNHFIENLDPDSYSIHQGTFDHLKSYSRLLLKLLYSSACFFIHPKFYLYNLFFLLKSNRYSLRFINDFINVTYLFSRYKQFSKSDKVVIFDQGLVQAYWSIKCFSENDKEYDFNKIKNYIQKVIIVSLDLSINKERISQRNQGKSRAESHKDDLSFLNNQFNGIKNTLEKDSIVQQHLYIDSSRGLDDNASEINHYIKRIIYENSSSS